MEKINQNNELGFNFTKFRTFKKKLNKYLKEKYWKTLKELFENKETREAIFKYIFWFEWNTNIFWSWRKENIDDINLDESLIEIIEHIKIHTKKTIYSE